MIWIPILTTVALLAGYLVAEQRENRTGKMILKPLASCGFLTTAIMSGAFESQYGTIIFIGLVLSFGGDVFLLSLQKKFFRAGIGSFLLGHVAYVVAFSFLGLDVLWLLIAAVVVVGVAVLILRWLWPSVTEDMRGAVVAYIVVISVMVIFATGTIGAGSHYLILVGAVGFYLSDISVARDRFVKQGFINRVWGLPCYYGSQLILAVTVAL